MFERKAATIIRDRRQRRLLERWEARRGGRALPRLADLHGKDPLGNVPLGDIPLGDVPSGGDPLPVWDDLVLYEVRRGPPAKRYRVRLHGRVAAVVRGEDVPERYLEDTIPAPLHATIRLACDATVVNRCPIYTVRDSVDAAHHPIVFEHLLLPVSVDSDNVDIIITHLALNSAKRQLDWHKALFEGVEHGDYRLKAIISAEAELPPQGG